MQTLWIPFLGWNVEIIFSSWKGFKSLSWPFNMLFPHSVLFLVFSRSLALMNLNLIIHSIPFSNSSTKILPTYLEGSKQWWNNPHIALRAYELCEASHSFAKRCKKLRRLVRYLNKSTHLLTSFGEATSDFAKLLSSKGQLWIFTLLLVNLHRSNEKHYGFLFQGETSKLSFHLSRVSNQFHIL